MPPRLAEEKVFISIPAGLLQEAPLIHAFLGPVGDESEGLGYAGVFLSGPGHSEWLASNICSRRGRDA